MKTKNVSDRFQRDDIGTHSAALAYYMIFSIVPILILLVSALGFFSTETNTEQSIAGYFRTTLGPDAGGFFRALLENISSVEVNTIASLVGLGILVYAATGIFHHLRETFALIFNLRSIEQRAESLVKNTLRKRLLAIVYMAVFFIVLFVLVLANIGASLIFQFIQTLLAHDAVSSVVYVAQHLTTLVLGIGVFTLVYRFASVARVSWKSALVGATLAGTLFAFVNILLSTYLAVSNSFSPYGAAGFFVVLLLWFYYVSMSLFLGAEVSAEDGSV